MRSAAALTGLLGAVCCLLASVPSPAAVYHVDAGGGDDTHTGLSPAAAWRSLAPVNAAIFQPGDQILLRAGTRYSGRLAPQGSGALVAGVPAPIRLGRYGAGPPPRVDAGGNFSEALLLRNVEYWDVADLELTNLGPAPAPGRAGVRLQADGAGPLHQLSLHGLYVHDVNGDLAKSREGCGIFFESRGGNDAHFEGLLIADCRVARTDRNGICQRTSGRARSLGVVIRGCRLEDIGGDGIKIWGSRGALVEHNVLRGGRRRCADAAAGIWPFDSDDTVIQYNEVSGMKGTNDGQAFDADYRCRHSLFQYNYSHDNEGGFLLVCTPGNSFCLDTVVRYNLSQNDGVNGGRIIHFGGGAANTLLHNNVIYVGPDQDLPLVRCTEWNRGRARDTRFVNNIFYVAGRVTYDFGTATNTVFDHNVFYGGHVNPPPDAFAVTNAPPLRAPGSGGAGFASLTGYQPAPGSVLPPGISLPNPGEHDFFGRPLPTTTPPARGLAEAPAF